MIKTKILFSVLSVFASASYVQSKSLNATDILKAYQQTMEKSLFHREKSAFKAESKQEIKYTYNQPSEYENYVGSATSKITFFHNGNRIDYRLEETIFDYQIPAMNKSQYLLDNEYGFEVRHPLDKLPRYVSLYTNNRWKAAINSLAPNGTPFEGYVTGDSSQSLWEVLKKEPDLRLRDEMEEIDGHKTYVLEAKTNHGHYTLWIDPNCGYNLRRCVVHRKDNDLINGEPLNKQPQQPPSGLSGGRKRFPVVEHVFTFDSIRIKNFDGLFLPVEGTVSTNEKYSNGDEYKVQYSYKRFDIDLDPDFSKFENAFVLDVPDGTPVYYKDTPESGASFIWHDGKIVPDVDDLVIEELDKMTQQIMEDGDVPPKLGSVKETEKTEDELNIDGSKPANAAEPQHEILSETNIPSFYILIPIGLLIVAIIGWKVFGWLKT